MQSETSYKTITFADLFAGIGGFRLGIGQASQKLGIPVKCVFSSEIEKNARIIYEKNFKEAPQGDITKIQATDVTDMDILCGGFPCQAFSIAGKRRGFDDTRGTLFFEIARLAKEKHPKIIFLENVKGLFSHDRGRTFATILIALDELGYDVEWQLLNSKNFGVPQNRERVFIIGHLRGSRTKQIFPIFGETGATAKQNISTAIDANYWKGIDNHGQQTGIIQAICDSGKSRALQTRTESFPPLRNGGGGCGQNNFIVYPILTPDRLEKRQNGRRIKNADEPMFTLTAQDQHGVLLNKKIRKLTPVECERLQAYPDKWTEGVSDSMRYKCLSNAVTVNVIEAIAEKILLALVGCELVCQRKESISKAGEKQNALPAHVVKKT